MVLIAKIKNNLNQDSNFHNKKKKNLKTFHKIAINQTKPAVLII